MVDLLSKISISALISLREGLEAALIVGIVIGYLVKSGQGQRARVAWLGVLAAVALSAVIAVGLSLAGAGLEEPYEQIFEGSTMFLAVIVITWMVFWMRFQARFLKTSLEKNIQTAATSGQTWALFGVAFLAVFREGVETALFLAASALAVDGTSTLIGALIGLGAATLLGWLIYASTVRLNVGLFFNVTSIVLLFFAAGLFAHGVHEFQEVRLLPLTIEHVWDINHILNEQSTLGEMLKALFGYNGNPSLLEVLSYVVYWVLALAGVRWWVGRRAAQLTTA